MATELFANNYVTTLASSMTSGATTAVMTTSVPSGLAVAGGQWRLLVDNEIMLVTAVNGDLVTLTVTRAQEGTGAATHASGAAAAQIVTAAALANLAPTGIVTKGTLASLPAAGVAGRLYLPTDAPFLSVDNGSAWFPYGPVFPLTLPNDASFSWANQGSCSIDTSKGGVWLNAPASTSGFAMRILTPPAAPYTATLGFIPNLEASFTAFSAAGILLRDSASGKLTPFYYQWRSDNFNSQAPGLYLMNEKWSATNTFSGTYISQKAGWQGAIAWLRIVDDGTNRKYQVSTNQFHWQTIWSVVNTDYITPNQAGFGFNSGGTLAGPTGMHVLHWSVTTP